MKSLNKNLKTNGRTSLHSYLLFVGLLCFVALSFVFGPLTSNLITSAYGAKPVKSITKQVIPKSKCAHLWNAGATQVEATCTVGRKVKYYCNKCGTTETRVVGSALGHSWVKKSTNSATCTKAAEIVYECKICGQAKTETSGSPLGHNWGSVSSKNERRCTRCYAREYVCNHSWVKKSTNSATCTKAAEIVYECKICGQAKTETSGSPLGHNWGSVSSKNERRCTRCYVRETVIPTRSPVPTPTAIPHTHSWGSWVAEGASVHRRSCTLNSNHYEIGSHSDGNKDGKCDLCGYQMSTKTPRPTATPIKIPRPTINQANCQHQWINYGTYRVCHICGKRI